MPSPSRWPISETCSLPVIGTGASGSRSDHHARNRLISRVMVVMAIAAFDPDAGCPPAPPGKTQRPQPTLTAETHNSGFALAHDTYNGLSSASDGRIYYVLSTEPFDVRAPASSSSIRPPARSATWAI